MPSLVMLPFILLGIASTAASTSPGRATSAMPDIERLFHLFNGADDNLLLFNSKTYEEFVEKIHEFTDQKEFLEHRSGIVFTDPREGDFVLGIHVSGKPLQLVNWNELQQFQKIKYFTIQNCGIRGELGDLQVAFSKLPRSLVEFNMGGNMFTNTPRFVIFWKFSSSFKYSVQNDPFVFSAGQGHEQTSTPFEGIASVLHYFRWITTWIGSTRSAKQQTDGHFGRGRLGVTPTNDGENAFARKSVLDQR